MYNSKNFKFISIDIEKKYEFQDKLPYDIQNRLDDLKYIHNSITIYQTTL